MLAVLGQDPAQSSSIILTTVTDVTGFFSFLGIATLLAGLIQPAFLPASRGSCLPGVACSTSGVTCPLRAASVESPPAARRLPLRPPCRLRLRRPGRRGLRRSPRGRPRSPGRASATPVASPSGTRTGRGPASHAPLAVRQQRRAQRPIPTVVQRMTLKARLQQAALHIEQEVTVKGGEKPDQRAEQNTATAAVGVRWSEGVGMRPGAVSAGNEGRA